MNRAVYLWAVGGVVLILLNAIVRLTPLALTPILSGDMGVIHWAVAVPWVGVMVWTEGVKGFHQRFCPRVVARAQGLHRHPTWTRVLGPATAMGLLWATRRRLIGSWVLVLGIVVLVILIQRFDQPWRGVVDLGVVAGLSTGTASLLWHARRGWGGAPPDIDPDWPAPA